MKKAGNDRSLRAILATKTKRSLWDVARHLYGFAGAERTAKAELVDFLEREIVAQPLLIAATFPPIDQEVGEALWSAFQWGSARMEYAFDNHKRILRELSFVGVKQDGEDDIVVYVPDEICKLYADEEIRQVWREHFDDNNMIDDLVRACVLRYGHVTVGEIMAFGFKWCGFPKTPEMKVAIKRVIGGRSRSNYGEADYCMLGDAVMHLSVCGRSVREFARLAPEFVARRKPYPRWQPKTLDELLEVLDDDYYEKTPATHRLVDMLCGEFGNDPEIVDEFFADLTELVTAGDDLKKAVTLMGFLGIVVPKSANKRVVAAIQDFANHARLRWLNGHTPAEVGETYKPLDADKVIYADDIYASDLRFPVVLPDADGSDFDDLDDELETDEPYEEEDEDDDSFLDDFEDDYEDYDGSQEPIRRDQPRIGRNDPCPCGSGKKYKKCCGRNA